MAAKKKAKKKVKAIVVVLKKLKPKTRKKTKNPPWRPPKYKTPEAMQEVIDLYYLACKVNLPIDPGLSDPLIKDLSPKQKRIINDIEDIVPTISGLAYALGMSRRALLDYEGKPDFLLTVKRAKQKVEMSLEQRLAGNNVTGSIFNLKNNFGWKDKTEHEISGPEGGPIHAQVTFVGVNPKKKT